MIILRPEVRPHQVRVDLEVMALKRYFSLPRYSVGINNYQTLQNWNSGTKTKIETKNKIEYVYIHNLVYVRGYGGGLKFTYFWSNENSYFWWQLS